jgi:hypothetical protein
MDDKPAKRAMRSARSASREDVEGLCWWPGIWEAPVGCPRWPSLIATVERAEREVVVLVGVPGISDGVSGCEGGCGRLMKVGGPC